MGCWVVTCSPGGGGGEVVGGGREKVGLVKWVLRLGVRAEEEVFGFEEGGVCTDDSDGEERGGGVGIVCLA